MRFYSEDTVRKILADYDEDVGGIHCELTDYAHIEDPVSRRSLLEAFDNYGCPKERNTYLFKALRKLVEDAHEL